VPITLTPRIRRRTALAAATVALSVGLTGCGAGFNAQTTTPYQAAEGTNAASGSIAVRNMLVLAAEDGKGQLYGVIVNTGRQNDELTGITAAPPDAPSQDETAGSQPPAPVTFSNIQPITLPAGGASSLSPTTGRPVTVTGAKPGQIVKVTLTFSKAAPVTTSIPVLTLDHYSPTPRPSTEGER
jgi:copper(I)-binding protein